MMSIRSAVVILSGLSLLAGPLAAQPVTLQGERQRLKQLQQQQQAERARAQQLAADAAQLQADISTATSSMVTLAGAIQEREDRLYGLESQLKLLKGEQAKQVASLNSRREQVIHLLAALQNISRRPPQLLLVRPGAAIDTARSASLLTAVLPELRRQTEELRREVAVVLDFRDKLEAEHAGYVAELAAMRGDRTKLDSMRLTRERNRSSLLRQSEAADARAKELAAQARDIRDLLARLEIEDRKRARLAALPGPRPRPDFRRPPAVASATPPRSTVPAVPSARRGPTVALNAPRTASRPMTAALGALALPVRGEVITQFGQIVAAGASRGIAIRARADAQVVAPYAGRVVFAGPFRSMGQTLIIAHGEGYHSVLSGFTRIDARKDQLVQAGEPVGVMGPEGGSEGSTLYVEIRKGGEPVNPLPWLSAGLRRTQG